ncbi:MAG: hypothetical protein R2697_20430 [Ilumatobacteraceae bacterium]
MPKPEWTHEAHLIACWVELSVRGGDVDATLDSLRDVIRSYNEATGVANTATGGYHETITRYYVDAVAAVGATTVDELLADPRCSRDAPLRLWPKEILFTPEARAIWLPPTAPSGQVSEVTPRTENVSGQVSEVTPRNEALPSIT